MKVKIFGDTDLSCKLREDLTRFGETIVEDAEEASYFISAQYGKIFSQQEIEKFSPILNIHFSDTSVMRGCNVMTHAIEHELPSTAVTFHWVDNGIDTGDVLFRVPIEISSDDTARQLYDRCVVTASAYFRLCWGWLRTKPDGTKLDPVGEYYTRRLDTCLNLTKDQERFLRSRIFGGSKMPILKVGGETYTLKRLIS